MNVPDQLDVRPFVADESDIELSLNPIQLDSQIAIEQIQRFVA